VIEIIETSPDRIQVAREQVDQILDWNDLDALTPLEVIAAVTLVRPFTTSKGIVVRANKGPPATPFRSVANGIPRRWETGSRNSGRSIAGRPRPPATSASCSFPQALRPGLTNCAEPDQIPILQHFSEETHQQVAVRVQSGPANGPFVAAEM
jgi:hypothetical protein